MSFSIKKKYHVNINVRTSYIHGRFVCPSTVPCIEYHVFKFVQKNVLFYLVYCYGTKLYTPHLHRQACLLVYRNTVVIVLFTIDLSVSGFSDAYGTFSTSKTAAVDE